MCTIVRRDVWSFAAVCLAPALYAAPAGVKFTQSASSIACFDYLEVALAVEKPDAANPFADVSVTGEAAREGEAPIRVDGFCDAADGSVYRIRFMPRKTGEHRYGVRYQQGDFVARHEGTFSVTKGAFAGPIRVDPEHPFHFQREGTGEHWFWNATTTYQILAWDDETIKQSITRLAGLGVNRIRVAFAGRTRDGKRWNEPLVIPTEKFRFKMEPWLAARPENLEDPGYDVTRFNLAHFQRADRLLRLTRQLGIVVSVVFYVDGRDKGVDPFGPEKMGGPDEQRYYRYMVARLAAFENVMWDLANEWHLFRDEAWVNRMGAFVKECDPYRHLASVHGRGDFPYRKSPWSDFAMFQEWDEGGGYKFMLKNRREQAAAGRNMPQVNEEYGYEDHYPSGWGGARGWPARIGDNRRRLAWEMVMAGCYQTTGERANEGTGAGADTGGGWINGRGDEHMTLLLGHRHMKDFFTSFDWWTLEPRDDLAGEGTLVLAEAGKVYVAYMPRGGAAAFQLAQGSYVAKWFNPRTGESLPAFNVMQAADGAWTSPKPADSGDWALLLRSGK